MKVYLRKSWGGTLFLPLTDLLLALHNDLLVLKEGMGAKEYILDLIQRINDLKEKGEKYEKLL
jgi:hypothetical protein